LRKNGIFQINKKAVGEKCSALIRERRNAKADELVMCGYCRGLYAEILLSA